MTTSPHISVISIPVSDQERAKAFYAETLGFEVLTDAEFAPGRRWVHLAPPGAQTTITLTTWFDDFPPGSLRGLILDVPDVEAARGELGGRGLTFTGEIDRTPWGRFLAFEDPDGNRWSLHDEVVEGG
jgi:catechol 2,3-dioxygenase-like lactoylglutathione lyase family enzyme